MISFGKIVSHYFKAVCCFPKNNKTLELSIFSEKNHDIELSILFYDKL